MELTLEEVVGLSLGEGLVEHDFEPETEWVREKVGLTLEEPLQLSLEEKLEEKESEADTEEVRDGVGETLKVTEGDLEQK